MTIKPSDLSIAQRDAVMLLTADKGLTTREIGAAIKVKNPTALLDSLRNRGIARATGHYSPARCKWTLTESGLELQAQIVKALPN